MDRWFLENLNDYDDITVTIISHLIWLPKLNASVGKLLQMLSKSLLVTKHPLFNKIKKLTSDNGKMLNIDIFCNSKPICIYRKDNYGIIYLTIDNILAMKEALKVDRSNIVNSANNTLSKWLANNLTEDNIESFVSHIYIYSN